LAITLVSHVVIVQNISFYKGVSALKKKKVRKTSDRRSLVTLLVLKFTTCSLLFPGSPGRGISEDLFGE
jgi:hypothetical protein